MFFLTCSVTLFGHFVGFGCFPSFFPCKVTDKVVLGQALDRLQIDSKTVCASGCQGLEEMPDFIFDLLGPRDKMGNFLAEYVTIALAQTMDDAFGGDDRQA